MHSHLLYTHAHRETIFFLPPQASLLHLTFSPLFPSIYPSHLIRGLPLNLTPFISNPFIFFHQSFLLHSFHTSEPSQHTQLASVTQLSHNTIFHFSFIIFHFTFDICGIRLSPCLLNSSGACLAKQQTSLFQTFLPSLAFSFPSSLNLIITSLLRDEGMEKRWQLEECTGKEEERTG